MKKNIDLVKRVSLIVWTIAVFAYFFQFPWANLSKLIIPSLGIYLLFYLRDIKIYPETVILLFAFFIYLIISVVIALINGTDVSRIARFCIILLTIVYCCIIRISDFRREVAIFVNLAVMKAFLITIIAISIILLGDYSVFRNWALDNAFGDIYYISRFFPKIQVMGNALLVIAFIVEYMRRKKVTFKLVVLLCGIIYAGNFAYIIGIMLFVIYELLKIVLPLLKNNKKLLPIVVTGILISYIIVLPYLLNKIEQKSEVSNKIRVEQAEILLDANIFVGEGLGNYIKASTKLRDYDGAIYYELQTLYIINQIGFAGLLMFYAIIFSNLKKCGMNKLVIYLIYLIYAFWNPYCFDTTQMIATILIINLIEEGEDGENSNCNCLLSKCK